VTNTRTHGGYVGAVRDGLVVQLLKIWVWVGQCGVSWKPWVTRSGHAPLGKVA
jgi:hypothetical protein